MSTTAIAPAVLIAHDVGVSGSPTRRRFPAAYKLKIIADADACTKPGDVAALLVAALLRREGLYSSNLAAWRAANRRGELTGAAPRRGPKPAAPDAAAAVAGVRRIAELERKLARATARAERAEALVAVQKKVSALLDQLLPSSDDEPTGTN